MFKIYTVIMLCIFTHVSAQEKSLIKHKELTVGEKVQKMIDERDARAKARDVLADSRNCNDYACIDESQKVYAKTQRDRIVFH